MPLSTAAGKLTWICSAQYLINLSLEGEKPVHEASEPAIVFGTRKAETPGRVFELGDLSFEFRADMVRRLCWCGLEVVRGIAWPVRDPNWITLPQKKPKVVVEERSGEASIGLDFSVGGGALRCRVDILARDVGTLVARVAMTAQENFSTNRAGFTVLHPIEGVSGRPLRIRHSDGTEEKTSFPMLISPGQPAFDIVGMRHGVGRAASVDVDIGFEGEVFEMEDQRNWSDGSFKTYCRPLTAPFTYEIPAGETVRQSVMVAVSGDMRGAPDSSYRPFAASADPLDERFPEIGLAVEDGWICDDGNVHAVKAAGPSFLQLRTGPGANKGFLARASKFAAELEVPVEAEIVLADDRPPEESLEEHRDALSDADINPARVTALPEAYLLSYQPSGPWPTGLSPRDAALAARRVFPNAGIGGGVLTNFTEFNRHRPGPSECDFYTHGVTPIVHAADDQSVIETLEAFGAIFASGSAICPSKPCRLGLVSIGMRSNPYGAAVADNPDHVRQPMAMHDPRHTGLFAAAWAVGAIAATAGHPVEALSIAAPSGPFGIISEPQPVPRPMYDRNVKRKIYPLFHVFRFASGLARRRRMRFDNTGDQYDNPLDNPYWGLHGFAAVAGSKVKAVVTNLGHSAQSLKGPGQEFSAAVLDESSFGHAMLNPNWLNVAPRDFKEPVTLKPYATAFLEFANPGG